MSRTHDGHHRSIFPFGNLFKVRTKDSYSSSKIASILKTFEGNLAVNLVKLRPENGSDIPSFCCIRRILAYLSNLHRDVDFLIADLDFPVSNWEQHWIDIYLEDSLRVLDVCNTFSSELSRFERGQLLMRCVMHILAEGSPSQEQVKKANVYLGEWRQEMNSGSPKLKTLEEILKSLSGSLHSPSVKKSAKGKVLMRAMYAVKVITIFACSLLSVFLTGSGQLLVDFHVSEDFAWAQAFHDLQSDVNREIRTKFSCRQVITNETDAVGLSVVQLLPMIDEYLCTRPHVTEPSLPRKNMDDDFNHAEPSIVVKDNELNVIPSIVSVLGIRTKILSDELEGLSKEVRNFFQIVMNGRDVLLGNLKNSDVLKVKNFQKSKSRLNVKCILLPDGASVVSGLKLGDDTKGPK